MTRRPGSYDDGRMNRIGGRWIHYDKHGEPIEWLQWAQLIEQGIGGGLEVEYRRIGSTEIGEVWISTVWLGIDHNWTGTGPPIIFETLVRGGENDDAITRYATEAEAIEGHLRTVADIQAGRPLWFEQTQEIEQ